MKLRRLTTCFSKRPIQAGSDIDYRISTVLLLQRGSCLAVLMLLILISGNEPCHGQAFDAGGNGTSWNDRFNWSANEVPDPEGSAEARIQSNNQRGFSAQVNSATSAPITRIRSSNSDFNASLSINAPFSPSLITCEDERSTLNINANTTVTGASFSGVSIVDGATLNLNSGTLISDRLNLAQTWPDDPAPFINQNGGHFNVERLSMDDLPQLRTITIGPNDNVTTLSLIHI